MSLMFLVFISVFNSGCASSQYSLSNNYDDSIKTIAVPIFQNDTLERGLELQLAESLNKQIKSRTPWTLAKTGRADTTLVGVITSHSLGQLSRVPGAGLAQEQTVSITVRFEWRDNRTGDIIVARSRYTATSAFVPQRGINERIEHGQREAIEELATDIISELRQSW
jgi:lipopolysaccharide assembly LptE-like protein